MRACSRHFAIGGVIIAALFVAPPTAANRFSDNLSRDVDRSVETWTSPIGELETVDTLTEGGNTGKRRGTAFLVSPCFVATNQHVVFGEDVTPNPGKAYRMIFRAGTSATSPFAGHTIATPVVWGPRRIGGMMDWALLKLSACLGRRPEFGWFELAGVPRPTPGSAVLIAGYPGNHARGEMQMSVGRAMQVDPARSSTVLRGGQSVLVDEVNGLQEYTSSTEPGQSGSPVLMLERGRLTVVGMHTAGSKEAGTDYTFPTFTSAHANDFIPALSFLGRRDVVAILKEDNAGYVNPAAERQRMDHLPL